MSGWGCPSTVNVPTIWASPSGRQLTAPVASVWGSAVSAASIRSWKPCIAAASRYLVSGRSTVIDMTCAGRKPSSIVRSRWKLRSIRPAPVSSIRASATSATTSPPRSRPRPVVARMPLPGDAAEPGPVAATAGASPNATPVTRATPKVNSNTPASIRMSCVRGIVPAGASASSPRIPASATGTPTAAPSRNSTVLSVSSWRTSRPRPAPSAVRIATSFRRAAPRMRSRFATFAHAMSSTNATAPASISRERWAVPTRKELSG